MKRILLIILVIVLAITAYFWYQNNSKATLTTLAPVAEVSTSPITMDMVAGHASATDCWMVIDGKVIDVSNFVGKHPGGDVIVQGCGKDATALFNNTPQHLRGVAQTLLGTLAIGKLAQ
jgi:cytochrome b involved in lipid metabolism